MGVLDLINGEALTFLRRALPEELDAIPLEEVSVALREPMERTGLTIDDAALADAADATVGYAYLIQLIGYQVWRAGKGHIQESSVITEDDVKQGVAAALKEFNSIVHESAIAGLPLRALEYLLAMAQDEGVSSTNVIAERLQEPPSSLTSYRRMLIQRQLIEPSARGFVTFSIPYIQEYLRENKDDLLARYGR